MIAARQGDGRFGPSQWVPNSAPGHWQPLVNAPAGQQILDPTPWVGGVKPFLLQSSSQFRTSPPPALDSAAYAAEFNEVKAIGSAASATRRPDQTYIARWWQTPPHKNWNDVARDLIGRNAFDIVDSARLFAMQNLSAADAAINCWNDKYHYDHWRPWNAIPRAAEDGNPATTAEAGWTPLIAAPVPRYSVRRQLPRRRARGGAANGLRRRHRQTASTSPASPPFSNRETPPRVISTRSRSHLPSSSRSASGPACTSVSATCKGRSSE